jgi:eukaryotic-like serine/threonine-protein kinase
MGDPLVVADEAAVVVPWQRGQFSIAETALAYSRTGRPLSQLTWIDRAGKPLGTAGVPGFYNNLDLSPDDKGVAVSRTTEQAGLPWNFDIWTIDLASGTTTRLTTHSAREFDPAWSPDGTDIAFISSRIGGTFSLFRRSANGSGEDKQLVSGGAGAPDWSPDRVVMFTAPGQATGSDLWTVAVSDDPRRQEFLKTPFAEAGGEFSPNGQLVAYQSNESGRNEVYVRPFPKGARIPISRDGGRAARWRGDGKELFFLTPDGMLMAAAFDSSKGLLATVPQPLFQTHIVFAGNNHPFAVTSDGNRFLIPVILNPAGAAPITVVLNWSARLSK